MIKLLCTELLRLKRSLAFWCFVAIAFFTGAVTVLVLYGGGNYSLVENSLYFYGAFMIVLSAAFTGVFLGDEHEKTLRNKVAVGCRRSDIYFSSLIAVTVAVAAFMIAYFISAFAIGVPLSCYRKETLGAGYSFVWKRFSLPKDFSLIVCAFIALQIAYAAVYTAIVMNTRNKGVAVVAALVGTLLLLAACFFLHEWICDLKWTYGRRFPYGNKGFLLFISEFQRFLPTGQSVIVLMGSEGACPLVWRCVFYSLFVVLIATVIGAISFRKRDLK